MRHRRRYPLALVAAASLILGGSAELPALAAGHSLPGRVYAPYFETWTKDSIPAIASRSGARFLTLAFLQAAGKKGAAACTVTWDGNKRQPVSAGKYLAQITRLRRNGGDVIPSFGGYSADQGGTEIADSCPSVAKIAKA